jgi:hypothetical protein
MQRIDALLHADDGLRWFNRLYLMLTLEVDQHPPESGWHSPEWLLQLDVIFAELYFQAVQSYLNSTDVPSAWQALFEARDQPGIDRIQFALAGMNAHINHDLALALIATDQQLNPGSRATQPSTRRLRCGKRSAESADTQHAFHACGRHSWCSCSRYRKNRATPCVLEYLPSPQSRLGFR